MFYWTGRWYKEWYFLQFGIPYEVLGFNREYYLFGSWATVATAASALFLVVVPIAMGWNRLWWPYGWLSIFFLGIVIALQAWHPQFHPEAPFWKKLLGSNDLVVMAGGFAIVCVLGVAFVISHRIRALLVSPLAAPWSLWLIIFLLSWAYLAGMGYIVGRYHGQAAIWEGKMGTRWVKHDGSWCVFAVRADAERNFILDRVRHRTKAVADGQIEEWDGPVTRTPK